MTVLGEVLGVLPGNLKRAQTLHSPGLLSCDSDVGLPVAAGAPFIRHGRGWGGIKPSHRAFVEGAR